MSAQRLNAKKTWRWARETGLPIVRMWAHGGYDFWFVTDDHRHGVIDSKTGDWRWDEFAAHYTSCHELFDF